jgi:alpha-L-fucosidase
MFVEHLTKCGRQTATTVALGLSGILAIPLGVSASLQDSVYVVTFNPNESVGSKLVKAAHVRPSPAQIKWMERERNIFLHYNMNTFHGSDWGTGSEKETDFAPTAQNPDQWAQVAKDAKFSMIVPTVKHHDGFCLWNTALTTHSIKNAAVTTDVVDALRKGCDNHGVDLGIYLSPWDMNQGAKGVWPKDAYNDYFIGELKELLGGKYGPVGELWFDGACGGANCPATFVPVPAYRTSMWYDTIEALQPMAVIRDYDGVYYADDNRWAGIKNGTQKLQWRGKEIRWCGNEGGNSRPDEWAVQPVTEQIFGAAQQSTDLGQESYYTSAVGALWYQAEINTSIASNQWFWHTGGYSLKSLSDLKTLYYNSIGNNSNLLLNLLPDNRGLIADDQIQLLKKWNNWIDSTFTKNLAKGAIATATAENAFPEDSGHEASKIIDNKRHTYWTTLGSWNLSTSTASITFELPTAQTFDHVMIKEYVYDGQRVAGWNLQYYDAGSSTWKSLVTGKKVIGYKRISQFNQVTTNKVRLNITRSWDKPEISDFALYKTMSGIDTTHEDTSSGTTTALAPRVNLQAPSFLPKILFNDHRLSIDGMGMAITRVEIARVNGRFTPYSLSTGSRLTPGIYLVKIHAGDAVYQEKIAVPL